MATATEAGKAVPLFQNSISTKITALKEGDALFWYSNDYPRLPVGDSPAWAVGHAWLAGMWFGLVVFTYEDMRTGIGLVILLMTLWEWSEWCLRVWTDPGPVTLLSTSEMDLEVPPSFGTQAAAMVGQKPLAVCTLAWKLLPSKGMRMLVPWGERPKSQRGKEVTELGPIRGMLVSIIKNSGGIIWFGLHS